MAENYASVAVVRQLFAWREGMRIWTDDGCSREQVVESSSGWSCAWYEPNQPGDGMIHGVLIVVGMNRSYKAESIETFG